MSEEEELECIERRDEAVPCTGSVESRPSLSGTGTPIARCDGHWEKRLDRQKEINERYAPFSDVAPAGIDPSYAGERWDDQY